MSTKLYPSLIKKDLPELVDVIDYIIKERRNDVNDFKNLPDQYISGRKVGKIPTSVTAAATDRLGDFSYDSDNLYFVVDNSGTAEWRFIPLRTDFAEQTFTPSISFVTVTQTSQVGYYTEQTGGHLDFYINVDYTSLNTGDGSPIAITLPDMILRDGAISATYDAVNPTRS